MISADPTTLAPSLAKHCFEQNQDMNIDMNLNRIAYEIYGGIEVVGADHRHSVALASTMFSKCSAYRYYILLYILLSYSACIQFNTIQYNTIQYIRYLSVVFAGQGIWFGGADQALFPPSDQSMCKSALGRRRFGIAPNMLWTW